MPRMPPPSRLPVGRRCLSRSLGQPLHRDGDGNHDGKTIDAFYGQGSVSAAGKGAGLNGLTKTKVGYNANTPVMVWSFGPDGMASADAKGNAGVNDDNVLSWQ